MSEHHKSKPQQVSVEMIAPDKRKPAILQADIVAESRLFKVESLHLKFSNGEERGSDSGEGRECDGGG